VFGSRSGGTPSPDPGSRGDGTDGSGVAGAPVGAQVGADLFHRARGDALAVAQPSDQLAVVGGQPAERSLGDAGRADERLDVLQQFRLDRHPGKLMGIFQICQYKINVYYQYDILYLEPKFAGLWDLSHKRADGRAVAVTWFASS